MSVRLQCFLHVKSVFQELKQRPSSLFLSCWSRKVMESLKERGLKPPDHVVLDNHRNKGLCPLSLLFLSLIFHTDCVGELLL